MAVQVSKKFEPVASCVYGSMFINIITNSNHCIADLSGTYTTLKLQVIKRGKKPAVFLDRDGTIIRDKGCISDPLQIQIYPYVFDSLRKLQEQYLLFIITNQPWISKGMVRQEYVDLVNTTLLSLLKGEGIRIEAVYCCPHQKAEECSCRKPMTYFAEKARNDFDLDLSASYVIGDHPGDVGLALNINAHGIYVLTGHGRKHFAEMSEFTKNRITIARNLKYATSRILNAGHDRRYSFTPDEPVEE